MVFFIHSFIHSFIFSHVIDENERAIFTIIVSSFFSALSLMIDFSSSALLPLITETLKTLCLAELPWISNSFIYSCYCYGDKDNYDRILSNTNIILQYYLSFLLNVESLFLIKTLFVFTLSCLCCCLSIFTIIPFVFLYQLWRITPLTKMEGN